MIEERWMKDALRKNDFPHSSEKMVENEALLRSQMKEMLAKCTEFQRGIFKRMYKSVDEMSRSKFDWAFHQIERTLKDNSFTTP